MIASDSDVLEPHETVRQRLIEAEEMLRAIRSGRIDALVVDGTRGSQVYTLHSAEEPYRLLVEQMQEGAVMLAATGHILYANARFAAMVGEPLELLIGTSMARFVPLLDRADFEALVTAGSGRRRGTIAGGGGLTLEVALSLSTTGTAGGTQLNLVVTDLSALNEAEAGRLRAQRESRTKDDFLAVLAHELRTPLSAISSAAAALARQPTAAGTAIAHAVIGRQVTHITQLVSDLLDIERVVSGKLRLVRQPIDVGEALVRATDQFTADPRFAWHVDPGAEPLWSELDPVRFDQVIANLLTNAMKYSPSGGRIGVTLSGEGSDVIVRVEDSGLGISPRLLPYVFDMYMQADRTIERAAGGLGIGLTLVRRIVELHGGRIEAKSDGEGHGSTFTVRLNRIPPTGRAAPELVHDRRTAGRRVLLIEDCDDAREMLRTMLEMAGHEVYAAPDAARGLALVTSQRPDVGIIDLGLPVMDGHQIAQRIRSDPNTKGILLFALTGSDAAEDAARSAASGFDRHLVKPLDFDYLDSLLRDTHGEPVSGTPSSRRRSDPGSGR